MSLYPPYLGALIGLARASEGNEHNLTADTHQVIIDGLLDKSPNMLQSIHAEKRRLIPGCFDCAMPCGKNNDYDMSQFEKGPQDVLALKKELLSGICQLARTSQPPMDFIYKALIVLGIDEYSADDMQPVLTELKKYF